MREELIFAACTDIAGKVRGKAFPASDLDKRLRRGVGWTPTNVQITCFDVIADSPFGALGDLLLVPDESTLTRASHAPDEPPDAFALGDILELDGTPWSCCTRSLLKAALARIERAGYTLTVAFEHEFQFLDHALPLGAAYSLAGFRAKREFAEALTASCRQNGLEPDTFMKEYGAGQYEVTLAPALGLRAADEAVLLRELVRGLGERRGTPVTFTPLRDPVGVGNGVHIHMSLNDASGEPASYDASAPNGVSAVLGSFVAGVLRHLPSIVALTAPSSVSYTRLTPHRWSASVDNFGLRDREAAMRLCPTTALADASIARQFNVEFRASDAAASAHLQLAALVHAGAAGIEAALPTPPATEEDLSLLDADSLAGRGYQALPASLPAALERLAEDEVVRGWFPEPFVDVYLAHKQGELAFLEGKSMADVCAAYEQAY